MRKKIPLFRLVIILSLTLVLTVVAIVFFVRINRVVIAQGQLVGGTQAVRAPWNGKVCEVLVKAGESVRAGQVLIRLDSFHLEAEKERLDSRIDSLTQRRIVLQSEQQRIVSEVHPAEKQKTARDLERARLELANSRLNFQRIDKLWSEKQISEIEFEYANLAFKLADLAVEEAKQAECDLASLQQGRIVELTEEIRAIEGQISGEETSLAEVRHRLDQCALTAGADGRVLGRNLLELPGQSVNAGDELLRLAGGQADRFEGLLDDSGRAQARPGLWVKIRLDGYPWLLHGTLAGRVSLVADGRNEGPGFPVEITFDTTTQPGPLYEGMRGEARIIVEERVSLGRLLLEKLSGKQER